MRLTSWDSKTKNWGLGWVTGWYFVISAREIYEEVSFSLGFFFFHSCSPLSSESCLPVVSPADKSVASQMVGEICEGLGQMHQYPETPYFCPSPWMAFLLFVQWSRTDTAITDLLQLLGWDADGFLYCNRHWNFTCLVYCVRAWCLSRYTTSVRDGGREAQNCYLLLWLPHTTKPDLLKLPECGA